MADSLSEMKKSIDGVSKSINDLSNQEKSYLKSKERMPVDVDLLTAEEINELRLLIENRDTLASFSAMRRQQVGDELGGMYQELERLNLILININSNVIRIEPMAYWAVEKYDQRTRERAEIQRRQWQHDILISIASALIGGALAIIGGLVASLY